MKSNIKFWLRIIALALLGMIVGIISAGLSLDVRLLGALYAIGAFVKENIFILYLITIALVDLLIGVYYGLGKKDLEKSQVREEDIEDDRKLVISIGLNSISMIILFVLFFTYASNYEITNTSLKEDAIVMGVLFVHVFYFSYMQKCQIELLKSYNPEKYDNILDMKFEKKYMESLDERELFESYKAGFGAYKAIMKTVFVLIFVLGIVSLTTDIFLPAIYSLGLVALFGTVFYLRSAIKSK